MHIIDITDPANPVWMGESGVKLYAGDVYADGNYAYASSYADEYGGTFADLDIFDVSDPAPPDMP